MLLTRNVTRLALFVGSLLVQASLPAQTVAIARIRLFNPTQSSEAAVVEVPVGQLVDPSAVDWQRLQLVHKGATVPFAIREGAARWRAHLTAPVEKPRAEDLLVFSLIVRPGAWSQVELVEGTPGPSTALQRREGSVIISYPKVRAVIDERTGSLLELVAGGESLLKAPLRYEYYEVDDSVATYERRMGPSYLTKPAAMRKMRALPPALARLVSFSSNPAMTEVNFVLHADGAPEVGLTYRFYANGQVDISADERSWSGVSPWLKHGMSFELSLVGRKELLPDFQTHFPRYGFRDYAAAVQGTGSLYRGERTVAVELGEESVNGRFWHRRIAVLGNSDRAAPQSLLELVDEGLVVQIEPKASAPMARVITLDYADNIKPVADIFASDLADAGWRVASGRQADVSSIALHLADAPATLGISGDGFVIRSNATNGSIDVFAGTTFGLFRATSAILVQLKKDRTIPLIAENPVVDLRAGGFGGAGHEVDFPLGDDAEWERALTGMARSGMNVMTDLGMWSNWKMPVFFKYMPELQSTGADAHDEVTGANFADFAKHRAHGLKLLNYLHDRGVKVWLWLPVGAIPTTFHEQYPDATVPGNAKIPRFMHPKYRELLNAYFRELLEVYPVDGFVLIRDDNGGIDKTEEWTQYLRTSRTRHPVWEQYLVIYDLLRAMNFKGEIAVYPYFDFYEPRLETLLPKDLLIVGHGSGLGALTRDVKTTGPMGDTWLDNLYTSFRLPTASRMKRLLSDRSSYWIGGAYESTELPWEAVGYFGWQPTATVNTLRYEFGARAFGTPNAVRFLEFSQAYERLWSLMDVPLLPYNWLSLSAGDRQSVTTRARRALVTYRSQLNRLEASVDRTAHKQWFAYVNHYEAFFRYYSRRVELFGRMHDFVVTNRSAADGSLPEPVRQRLIAMQREILALAHDYEQRAANVPGHMMEDTRRLEITKPFNELDYAGYEPDLDSAPGSRLKQFDGEIRVQPVVLKPGEPFELKIELTHRGVVPWIAGDGNALLFEGDRERFALPKRWNLEGRPMVFGDRRLITLRGTAPAQATPATLKVSFVTAYREWIPFSLTTELR